MTDEQQLVRAVAAAIDPSAFDENGAYYRKYEARRNIVLSQATRAIAALTAWNKRLPPEGGEAVAQKAIAACEGEQYHFEEWAKASRYDMAEHPLHYIFMDAKTDAARMGWNAALAYAREALEPVFAARAILSSDTGGDGDYERGVNDMREACAKAADSYRWNDLNNECCEGNMGWLLGEISNAIRALPSPATISTGSAK